MGRHLIVYNMPLKLSDRVRFSTLFLWAFEYGVLANNSLYSHKCSIQYLRTIKQLGSEYMKKMCSDIDNTIVIMSDGIHFHINGVINKHNY